MTVRMYSVSAVSVRSFRSCLPKIDLFAFGDTLIAHEVLSPQPRVLHVQQQQERPFDERRRSHIQWSSTRVALGPVFGRYTTSSACVRDTGLAEP